METGSDFQFPVSNFGNYAVEYTFNYRLPKTSPKEMDFEESLHSPLKRGMSDDTLTGVEAPKATRGALKYINPQIFLKALLRNNWLLVV